MARPRSATLASGSEMSLNYANTISNAITSSGGILSFASGNGGIYPGAINLTSSTPTTIGLRDFYSTGILARGTLNTGGLSEGTVSGDVPTPGISALTLTASSVLDLGASASVVTFANSSAAAWTSGTVLEIYDWSGNASGGGTDAVFFGKDATGLASAQLSQVSFYSDAGSTFLGSGGTLANGEVVPVPEPATVVGALLLVGVAGYKGQRQLRSLWPARKRWLGGESAGVTPLSSASRLHSPQPR